MSRAGKLVVSFALAVLVALSALYMWRRQPREHLASREATISVALERIGQLECARFHVQRVVELGRTQSRLFGLIDDREALLLVAAATVTAGIDLTQINASSWRRTGDGAISIELPPVVVGDPALDEANTFVAHQTHPWLPIGPRGLAQETLETEARRRAVSELREAAQASGIEEVARVSCTETLLALARGLGVEGLELRWPRSSGRTLH